jgi:hypothetical protein
MLNAGMKGQFGVRTLELPNPTGVAMLLSDRGLASQMVCQPNHSKFFRKIVHLSLR